MVLDLGSSVITSDVIQLPDFAFPAIPRQVPDELDLDAATAVGGSVTGTAITLGASVDGT